MTNQAITVTKILAVYAEIERKNELHDLVTLEGLKTAYLTEACAMWNTLQIMLGHESLSETIQLVHKLANNNKAAA
tara:strand:+ start:345 stop:572 length:228 start_codon:yes stop_codon:yes gene_type:complete